MKSKFSIRDICLIGLFAAMTVAVSQIAIPLPGGVPVTMQTFAVLLAGLLLGSKKGCYAILIYVLLGAIGLPVFAGFTGGIGVIFGATGGFILTFPLMAYIVGKSVEKQKNRWTIIMAVIIATLINFIGGTAMFMVFTGNNLINSLVWCVIPFIPGTIIKCVAAVVLGDLLRKRGLARL